MLTTPEQIMSANKRHAETLLQAANVLLTSAERVSSLQMNIARSLMQDSMNNAKSLMGVQDVQELMALNASAAQPTVEKMVGFAKSLYDITTQAQEEFTKIIESQISDMNKDLVGSLDKIAKSAPAGSDVAMAAVKSAIVAANSAYDSMSRAAKQVSDMAEANVNAATDATVKALGTAAAGGGAESKKTA